MSRRQLEHLPLAASKCARGSTIASHEPPQAAFRCIETPPWRAILGSVVLECKRRRTPVHAARQQPAAAATSCQAKTLPSGALQSKLLLLIHPKVDLRCCCTVVFTQPSAGQICQHAAEVACLLPTTTTRPRTRCVMQRISTVEPAAMNAHVQVRAAWLVEQRCLVFGWWIQQSVRVSLVQHLLRRAARHGASGEHTPPPRYSRLLLPAWLPAGYLPRCPGAS